MSLPIEHDVQAQQPSVSTRFPSPGLTESCQHLIRSQNRGLRVAHRLWQVLCGRWCACVMGKERDRSWAGLFLLRLDNPGIRHLKLPGQRVVSPEYEIKGV
jgi:hypothetical protein